ncbi:MAG: hypothetical protein C0594_06285, partial [Marinilabiliales bacterium]
EIDINSISAVFRNLITNAIKYTNPGGIVTISCTPETKGKFYTLSVKDTGIGMTDETVDSLFRIDKNISTRGTNNESGTGLGLILCKEFTNKNGGEIWAESVLNEGTTMYFTVPAKQ